jgi:hypothetical protein
MVEEGESSLEDGGEVQPVTSAPAFSLGVSKLPLHRAEIDDLDLITIVLNSSTQAGLSLIPNGEEHQDQPPLDSELQQGQEYDVLEHETFSKTTFKIQKVAKGNKGLSRLRQFKIKSIAKVKRAEFPSLTPHVDGSASVNPIPFKPMKSPPKRPVSIKPVRRNRFARPMFSKYKPILTRSKVNILMTTRSLSAYPIRSSRWVLVQISKGKNPRIKDMRIDFSKKKKK